jgi:multidrug efflux pump subunit AcrB
MIKLLIERNRAVFIGALLILIVGAQSYMRLPRESSPELKQPYIFVTTVFAGVAPEDIENLVTAPLEEKIDGLEGISKITSESRQSVSSVVVEFTSDVTVETALRRVKERVDSAKPDLPKDAEAPDVRELSSSDWPIFIVTLSNLDGIASIDRPAKDLQEKLKRLNGVLDVSIAGNLKREVAIQLDPLKLQHYGLSINDVSDAVQGENAAIPGGLLRNAITNYSIEVTGQIKDPSLFKDITVKSGPVKVRLGDLGTVAFQAAEPDTYSRINGQPAISLQLKKRTGQNIIDVVKRAKDEIDAFRSQFPAGTQISYSYDESKYVSDMLLDLENEMFTGFILVLGVTMLLLGLRNSLFVSLAIPFSMLIAFIVLDLMHITLNMVVLYSLILTLGMLVDDGIVMVENIYRHALSGKPRKQAAIEAASEIAAPVISSTLTTVLAFFPIIFMPGFMGDFMKYLPITVIVVLSASLIVAFTINPVFTARFLHISEKSAQHVLEGKGAFQKFQKWYEGMLRRFVARPGWTTVGAFAVVMMGFVMYGLIGREPIFFPKSDPSTAVIELEARQGTPLEQTDALSRRVEAQIPGVPASMDHYLATVGSTGNEEYHKAEIRVEFKPYLERKISGTQATENLKEALKDFTGANLKFEEVDNGPPSGHPVSYRVVGTDYLVMGDISQKVLDIINSYKVLTLVNTDYEPAKPEASVEIDRQKAAFYGLSTAQIASTVRGAMSGSTVGKYKEGNEEYDIVVRYQSGFRNSLDQLRNLQIVGKNNERIPLQAVATVSIQSSVGVIKRKNLQRAVEVWADFKENVENKEATNTEIAARIAAIPLPPGYQITTGEGAQTQQESTDFLAKAFLIALFLILILLIVHFNSLTDSIIIMTSVFMSLGGVFWGYALTGQVFVIMMSGIGCISLAGVAVKNCIVLVDYVNVLIRSGIPWSEAIITAGKVRLRPVLLTAVTAVLGMVPMAVGVSFDFHHFAIQIGSEQAEFWKAFAWAMIYGLTFATMMTLILVPTMLTLKFRHLDAKARRRQARREAKARI